MPEVIVIPDEGTEEAREMAEEAAGQAAGAAAVAAAAAEQTEALAGKVAELEQVAEETTNAVHYQEVMAERDRLRAELEALRAERAAEIATDEAPPVHDIRPEPAEDEGYQEPEKVEKPKPKPARVRTEEERKFGSNIWFGDGHG